MQDLEVVGGLESINVGITFTMVAFLLILGQVFKVLDGTGIVAAGFLGLVVGGLGHWSWLIIILAFLSSSYFATRWGWEEKKKLGLCESSDGHRGWTNVLANGGLPGLIAVCAFILDDWTNTFWVFVAAVAVATSDTWASEIGCLDPRVRLITNRQPVPPGTNGGYSPVGQWAAFLGASFISLIALLIGWVPETLDWEIGFALAFCTTMIGWVGCQFDSFLGAMLENRGLMTKASVNFSAITFGIVIAIFLILYGDF